MKDKNGKVWWMIPWMIAVLVVGLLLVGCGQTGDEERQTTEVQKTLTSTASSTPIWRNSLAPTLTAKPASSTATESSFLLKTATVVTPTLSSTHQPPTETPTPSLWPVLPGMIAFLDARNNNLRMIDTIGKDLGVISNTDSFIVDALTWSPDGHWLAFGNHPSGDGEIYLIRPNGHDLKRLTYSPHNKYHLSWSYDGKYIAYIDDGGTGLETDIVIVRVDTGETRKLTYTSGIESHLAWSPDGNMIAFLYRETVGSPRAELFVMQANGSDRKRVIDFPQVYGPLAWSPDGRTITFSAGKDGCGEIYIVNLDGSNLTQLTNLPGCAGGPTWSPDGMHISFHLSETKHGDVFSMGWQIYIMNADGSGLAKITTNEKWVPHFPKWAPVPALIVGDDYVITEAGDYLNLRESASLDGNILWKLRADDVVTIKVDMMLNITAMKDVRDIMALNWVTPFVEVRMRVS